MQIRTDITIYRPIIVCTCDCVVPRLHPQLFIATLRYKAEGWSLGTSLIVYAQECVLTDVCHVRTLTTGWVKAGTYLDILTEASSNQTVRQEGRTIH